MKTKRISKTWWRGFFDSVVGEIMFLPRSAVTDKEVARVLKATRTRPPSHVLDLACGVGRHSLAFSRRGFAVTGLDYSSAYLREARAAARKTNLPVSFVQGDMRHLREHFAPKTFDLVVSLFNSFGYFAERRDDMRVLREVFRVLRPGGMLVLNTLHASGVASRLKKPIRQGSEPLPKVFMIEKARYDNRKRETSCEWTIVDARRPKARIWRQAFRQNVYSHAEMKRMLRAAGFRIENVWGVLSGGPFDRSSWHQTIVARRPK
jgi:ubiquinone/menaquinone biosynthesis C-methylase UbiE